MAHSFTTFLTNKGVSHPMVMVESETVRDDGKVVVKEFGQFGMAKAECLVVMVGGGLSATLAVDVFQKLGKAYWIVKALAAGVTADDIVDAARALIESEAGTMAEAA
jgi:hypothetical protein